MALRNIVTEGDPVLRKRAREVEKVNYKERTIFADMVETMRASNGCGLAAPQVGLLKRMIVVEIPDPDSELEEEDLISDQGFHEEGLPKDEEILGEDPALKKKAPERELILYQLANPEIISASGSQIGEEGCLSVPGYIGNVDRPFAIHIKALDYDGKPVEIKAEGFLAVALSHELDHLDGILFTDKATEIEALEDQEE